MSKKSDDPKPKKDKKDKKDKKGALAGPSVAAHPRASHQVIAQFFAHRRCGQPDLQCHSIGDRPMR